MISLLSLAFLLFLVVFLIDAFPLFLTWQSRIRIGRFQDKELWKEKVLDISKKWLKNIPTIKLTDSSRLIIIDMLKGNYKRNAIQSWQEAALVLGLTQYFETTADETIKKHILHFIQNKINSQGSWRIKPTETDHAILAYAFLNADFVDHQKYRSAYEETYQMILSLKGSDGTVAYKKHNQNFRFVDTVGFICPFLIHYGQKFNVPEAVDLAILQIKEYQKYGMMNNENIPCHTYNVNTKIPTGLFGWGRGLGWFVIGLIDSWNALPNHHPEKKELEAIVIKTVNSVIKFQNNDGSFHWILFDFAARKDSSVCATLGWFFTVAAAIPEISELCKTASEICMQYLMSVTRRNGAIDFSQGDTKAIGIYSNHFDILPFTQGFCLRTQYHFQR